MSIYRATVWFFRGMREYTVGGYERAAASFQPNELDVDIANQSVMVTGSNSGIGKVTALEMAKRGSTVHMVCRSQERAEAAKQEIVEQSGNEKVFVHVVDMSKPKDILKFCKEFTESNSPLDVLVNNAGCMVHERQHQEDGLEVNFATNTVGTHILTTEMIPILEKSKTPRVIVVSSGGMYTVKLDPDDLNFDNLRYMYGNSAYAQNKRQQVVMTRLWSLAHPNIFFASMHPGWADTPAVQNSMPGFHRRMQDKLRTPEQGADTVVWLCLSERAAKEGPSGGFFQDRQVVGEHLPLAWTRSSAEEEQRLLASLEQIKSRIKAEMGQQQQEEEEEEEEEEQEQQPTGAEADQS